MGRNLKSASLAVTSSAATSQMCSVGWSPCCFSSISRPQHGLLLLMAKSTRKSSLRPLYSCTGQALRRAPRTPLSASPPSATSPASVTRTSPANLCTKSKQNIIRISRVVVDRHLLEQVLELLVVVFQVLELHQPLQQGIHILISSCLV